MKFNLTFPSAKGWVVQGDLGFWSWGATYLDGSGLRHDWAPTKRGAMICCLQACRGLARQYGKVKYKWTPA